MSEIIVSVKSLEKTYKSEGESLTILKDLNLEIEEGKKITIVGESGSGKSTFLNIIGGLDNATAGTVKCGPYELSNLDEKHLSDYRTHFLGLIFQFHYLLKDFTALENTFLPSLMAGVPKSKAIEKAKQLLCDVGLENRFSHLPGQLSGGERQRVAVARALMNDPKLILADEPTGNLDPQNAKMIGELLFSMAEKYNKTLLLVTHDVKLAQKGDLCYSIKNGRLESVVMGSTGLE